MTLEKAIKEYNDMMRDCDFCFIQAQFNTAIRQAAVANERKENAQRETTGI
jgi:cation transport regulator ChaB